MKERTELKNWESFTEVKDVSQGQHGGKLGRVAELSCQFLLLLFLVDWNLAGPVHLKLSEYPSSSPNSTRFQAYVPSGEFICYFLPSSLF